MAVRIQVRRGVQSEIPTLAVGEPGYDVDTKTVRMGDGTSSPPRVPTTKSSGTFDFRSADSFMMPRMLPNNGVMNAPAYSFAGNTNTGLWLLAANQIAVSTAGSTRFVIHNGGVNVGGNIVLSDNGTVDGVDISRLNAANGLMVRVGNNSYANRTLTGTANVIRVDNGDGVAGNPIIDIADNPQLPGVGFTTLPAGNTSQRPNPAFDGYLRFNNSPTYRCLELFVDGQWFQLTQKIQAGSYSITIPGTFNTFNEAFIYLSHIMTEGFVTINLGAGKLNLSQNNDFGRLPKGTRWAIAGAVPDTKAMTGCSEVTVDSTNGGWKVTYTVNSVAGVSVGDWVMVDRVNFDSTALGEGFLGFANGVGIVNGATVVRDVPAFDQTTQAGISYIKSLQQGGKNYDRRVVSTVTNATTLTMTGNSPFANSANSNAIYMRQVKLTGTAFMHGTDNFKLMGSGTQFLAELNVGDVISIGTSYATVKTIHSNVELTINGWLVGTTARAASGTPATAPGSGLQSVFCMRQGDLHMGTWKVTAVDGINNTISVNIKGIVAPPLKGMRTVGSTMRVMKTVLSCGNFWPFMVPDGSQIIVQDLAVVRELTTNPTNMAFYAIDGGEIEFRRYIAISGFQTGVFADRGSSIYSAMSNSASTSNLTATLSISNCSQGITGSSSRVNLTNTYITGCAGSGVEMSYGSVFTVDNQYGDATNVRSRGLVIANCLGGMTLSGGSTGVMRKTVLMSNTRSTGLEEKHNGGIRVLEGSRLIATGGTLLLNCDQMHLLVAENSYARIDSSFNLCPNDRMLYNNNPMTPASGRGVGIQVFAGATLRLRGSILISGCSTIAVHALLSSTINAEYAHIVSNRAGALFLDRNSYVDMASSKFVGNRLQAVEAHNSSGALLHNLTAAPPALGYQDPKAALGVNAIYCQRGAFVDVWGVAGLTNANMSPKPNALGYNFNAYVITQLV